MQVFIIGSPFETAESLDKRRLQKQIIECCQIIQAIQGKSKAWANHPCTKMYRQHLLWLRFYCSALDTYKCGHFDFSQSLSERADSLRPPFHTKEYLDQMKRRLYTKNNDHYRQWSHLGQSDINWYYVDGKWLHYQNGKLITHNL